MAFCNSILCGGWSSSISIAYLLAEIKFDETVFWFIIVWDKHACWMADYEAFLIVRSLISSNYSSLDDEKGSLI